jgi:hypothetical protein
MTIPTYYLDVKYFNQATGQYHTATSITKEQMLNWKNEAGDLILDANLREKLSKKGGIFAHIAYHRQSDDTWANKATWRTQEKFLHIRIEIVHRK